MSILRPGKYFNFLILTAGSYFIEGFRQEQDLKQLVTVSFALLNRCIATSIKPISARRVSFSHKEGIKNVAGKFFVRLRCTESHVKQIFFLQVLTLFKYN